MATIILFLDNSLINHAIGISLTTVLLKILKDIFSLAQRASHNHIGQLSIGFINSLKQCKCRLFELGSPVLNWILLSTLLHNLKDAYKSFGA